MALVARCSLFVGLIGFALMLVGFLSGAFLPGTPMETGAFDGASSQKMTTGENFASLGVCVFLPGLLGFVAGSFIELQVTKST